MELPLHVDRKGFIAFILIWRPGFRFGCVAFLIPSVLTLCMACTDIFTGTDQKDRTPVVQFGLNEVIISVGDSTRLWLLPMLPPGYVPSVEWSSSDSVVASVRAAGSKASWVKGLSPGETTIRAFGEGKGDSLPVFVLPDPSGEP